MTPTTWLRRRTPPPPGQQVRDELAAADLLDRVFPPDQCNWSWVRDLPLPARPHRDAQEATT